MRQHPRAAMKTRCSQKLIHFYKEKFSEISRQQKAVRNSQPLDVCWRQRQDFIPGYTGGEAESKGPGWFGDAWLSGWAAVCRADEDWGRSRSWGRRGVCSWLCQTGYACWTPKGGGQDKQRVWWVWGSHGLWRKGHSVVKWMRSVTVISAQSAETFVLWPLLYQSAIKVNIFNHS